MTRTPVCEYFFCTCLFLFYSGFWVEHTRAMVEEEGPVSVGAMCRSVLLWASSKFTVLSKWGLASFSVSRWGGTYAECVFACSLLRGRWALGDFWGQRPLLSCPRKPLSLGLQCSRHWRASVERSATRRLSSGAQLRSPSSAPMRRNVRPTWRAGQPQLRSRSGTQRDWEPLRTRELEPVRKTVCTAMENCHHGPERSIPLTCTFSTDKEINTLMSSFTFSRDYAKIIWVNTAASVRHMWSFYTGLQRFGLLFLTELF